MVNRFEGIDLGVNASMRRIVNNEKRKINAFLDELIILIEPVSKEAADILRSQKEEVG